MSDAINEFLFEGDAREKTLIKYPWINSVIVVVYVLFVKWLGPAIMKERNPLPLKYLIIFYDFAQVIANGYLTYTMITAAIDIWPIHCMMKRNPHLAFHIKNILRISWQLYLLKLSDLLDTCFFILRKKGSQITFLHVSHHALMVMQVSWGIRNLHTDAMGYYLVFGFSLNTSVHCVVYLYYGLAAFGPHMNKYLWWKKYLTQVQMVQFILILCYMAHGFWTGCEDVGRYEVTGFIYLAANLALFLNFYRKYKKE